MTDPEQMKHYDTRAGQWYRWQSTARHFVCAANCLLDWYEPMLTDVGRPRDAEWHYSSYSPLMVLYAAAVENLLKAVRIAQGTAATAGGEIHPYLGKHDMLKYAQDASIATTPDESDLLQKLRDVIESGKYPVAKAPDKSMGAWTFEYPRDVERLWAILERLEEALRATGKPCLGHLDLRRLCRRKDGAPTEVI